MIGYLLPSFTLNRNEWGQGLEIYEDGGGDSHSAVVKPPKMKHVPPKKLLDLVSTIVSVHPFLSQHLWKSFAPHPSVVAS